MGNENVSHHIVEGVTIPNPQRFNNLIKRFVRGLLS